MRFRTLGNAFTSYGGILSAIISRSIQRKYVFANLKTYLLDMESRHYCQISPPNFTNPPYPLDYAWLVGFIKCGIAVTIRAFCAKSCGPKPQKLHFSEHVTFAFYSAPLITICNKSYMIKIGPGKDLQITKFAKQNIPLSPFGELRSIIIRHWRDGYHQQQRLTILTELLFG